MLCRGKGKALWPQKGHIILSFISLCCFSLSFSCFFSWPGNVSESLLIITISTIIWTLSENKGKRGGSVPQCFIVVNVFLHLFLSFFSPRKVKETHSGTQAISGGRGYMELLKGRL